MSPLRSLSSRVAGIGRFRSIGRATPIAATLAALASCLGCFDRPIDPAEVTASILSAGEFEIRGGVPVQINSRERIPCEVGRFFGVDYRIELPRPASGRIPVTLRWRHPPLGSTRPGMRGTESPAGTPTPEMPSGQSQFDGRSLWNISRPDEQVAGEYILEIRTNGGSRTILSKVFEVEGC